MFPIRVSAEFKENDWLGLVIAGKLWYDFRDGNKFINQIDSLATAINSKLPAVQCEDENTNRDLFNKYWRGKVFVQGGVVGRASYHFESLDNIYINWSSGKKRDADGNLLAEYNGTGLKQFSNVNFLNENTFTGDIDFTDDGPRMKFSDDTYTKVWRYNYKISSDGNEIATGKVMREDFEGNTSFRRFGCELNYVLHSSSKDAETVRREVEEEDKLKAKAKVKEVQELSEVEDKYRRLYFEEKTQHDNTKRKLQNALSDREIVTAEFMHKIVDLEVKLSKYQEVSE